MKKLTIYFLFLSIVFGKAQTVMSSCTAPASIVSIYEKDAVKLSVKRNVKIGSAYKDSLRIDTAAKNRYLKALLAVFNATSLPARDTVVDLQIHSVNNYIDPNALTIQATNTLSWMLNIKNNVFPTGNGTLDTLLNKYSFQKTNYYYVDPNKDLAFFQTNSFYNMVVMAGIFNTSVPNQQAQPKYEWTWNNGGVNILDSVNVNFIELKYTVAWGDCMAGCMFNCSYKFRVYNDCSVEYLGHTGTSPYSLLLGLTKLEDKQVFNLYPNPVRDKLTLTTNSLVTTVNVLLINSLGQTVMEIEKPEKVIDVSLIPSGVYFLHFKSSQGLQIFKILKE